MLVLPLILLMMLAIIEIARVMHAWLAVVNGARFGVRYAVTNTYEESNCPVGGCTTDAEKQAARLESIREAAIAGSVSILRDLGETDWAEPGYFEVTVCSESASGYTASDTNNWTSDWTASCSPSDHPGDQGDLVWVTVDFNHPLIAPWLSADWPMLHLTSRRDAVVESFRTVRFVGAGPFTPAPTLTPSDTPMASDTPLATETATATATPCQVVPIVTIIDPADGSTYNGGDSLVVEAEAYDPDNVDPDSCTGVGTNGEGIQNVRFEVHWWDGSGWVWMDSQNESIAGYCGFGGNSPCNSITIGDDTWPSGNTVMSGLHRIRARARDDEGDWSVWEEVQITIDAPPTPTPTCSGVQFGDFSFNTSARIEQEIENTTYPGLEVTGVTVIWDTLEEGSDLNSWNFHVDWMDWDDTRINNGDDYTSSTSANSNMPMSADIGTHEIDVDWDGEYGGRLKNPPTELEPRHFGFSVTFSDPDCNLYRSPDPKVWPTPTITPTPEPTEVPSCDNIYITDMWFKSDDSVRVKVRNDNEAPGYLVSSKLSWPDGDLAPAYVDYFRFNGDRYYGGNDSSSPTGPISSSVSLAAGDTGRWEVDFDDEPDQGIWGTFSVDLTFDFDGGLSCSMSDSVHKSEPPPPTDTPVPSDTPTPSNTPDDPDTPTPTPTDDATPPTLDD